MLQVAGLRCARGGAQEGLNVGGVAGELLERRDSHDARNRQSEEGAIRRRRRSEEAATRGERRSGEGEPMKGAGELEPV